MSGRRERVWSTAPLTACARRPLMIFSIALLSRNHDNRCMLTRWPRRAIQLTKEHVMSSLRTHDDTWDIERQRRHHRCDGRCSPSGRNRAARRADPRSVHAKLLITSTGAGVFWEAMLDPAVLRVWTTSNSTGPIYGRGVREKASRRAGLLVPNRIGLERFL